MFKVRVLRAIGEYFTFTQSERNGIIVLIILIIITFAVFLTIPTFIKPTRSTDITAFEKEIIQFEKGQDSTQTVKKEKMYSFKDTYQNKTYQRHKRDTFITKLELNTADSAQLDKLPGIGPSFARRIIKYRNSLGGYSNICQLKEVYGLPIETLDKISNQFTIDTSKVLKLKINSSDFKVVNAHPYISFEQCKLLFNMRRKTKIYNSSQLEDSGIFSSEELIKLKIYLSYD